MGRKSNAIKFRDKVIKEIEKSDNTDLMRLKWDMLLEMEYCKKNFDEECPLCYVVDQTIKRQYWLNTQKDNPLPEDELIENVLECVITAVKVMIPQEYLEKLRIISRSLLNDRYNSKSKV